MKKQTVDQEDLIARYIEENPAKPGPADARLVGYGVPVWALIGYLPAVGNRARQVAADYDLPLEAVEAALAFYGRHQAVIDARIAANRVAATP
ncbi:MAG: DUF433 domain-containing protein [Dehalococcoidia bacterium]